MSLRLTRMACGAVKAVCACVLSPEGEGAPYGPLSSRKGAPEIADSEQFEQTIKKSVELGAHRVLRSVRARARAKRYRNPFQGAPLSPLSAEKGCRQRPPLMSEKLLLPTFCRARTREAFFCCTCIPTFRPSFWNGPRARGDGF